MIEWTSVTESLPDPKWNTAYLVMDRDGNIPWDIFYYDDGWDLFNDGENKFYRWDNELWHCYMPDVIAWIPLSLFEDMGWTFLSDRLPLLNKEVLICKRDLSMTVAKFIKLKIGDVYMVSGDGCYYDTTDYVLAWMPLPRPPRGLRSKSDL